LRVLSLNKEDVTVKNIFDGQTLLITAITLQNAQHPKNAHRVEAIKSGLYKELRSDQDATQFLSSILTIHLKNEINGIESEILKE